MPVLDLLVPALPRDRAAVLEAYHAKTEAARALLQTVRASHVVLAEQASRLDLNRLRHRLRADLVPVAGRLREYAIQLRSVLQHTDVPTDITAAYSLALGTKDDAAFNGAAANLRRDTDRYAGHAEHASILASRVDTELAALEDAADRLWAGEFQVVMPRSWSDGGAL
jgi:hypothetical protein